MFSITRLSTICLLAVAICWPCGGAALADTVRLTNGYTLHGKVVAEHPQSETHVKLRFSNDGWMLVTKRDVEEITPDNTDQFEMRNASGGPEE